ncbi:MAG: hypothetical protein ABTS22_21015 [Accumulibacter sp.]|uniref:hypothetical protein n=1 Tax=Accumulibacter sp. TaxID=2053492 RepID=UPI003315DEBD
MSGVKEFLQRETGHFMSLMEVLARMTADGSSHRDAARVLYGLLWHSRALPEWVVRDPTGLWIAEDEDTKKPWECLNTAGCGRRKKALDRFGFFAGEIIPFLAKHCIDIRADQGSATPVLAGAEEQIDTTTLAEKDMQELKPDAAQVLSGEVSEVSEQIDIAYSGPREVAPAGISKREVLSVDWPLPAGAPTLQNIIDSLPKWVDEACTKVGRVGKGVNGSHLWNPAILAFCLATKTPQKQWAAGKGALTSCLRRSFPDYLAQWEEAAKSL